MASKMTLGGDVDFQQIAKNTPGFVGADLSSLTKEAAVVAINRIFTRLRAVAHSPTTFPGSTPNEAIGNGIGRGAANSADGTGVVTKGSSPPAAAASEGGGKSVSTDEVMNGGGVSPTKEGTAQSPSPSLVVQQGGEDTGTNAYGTGAREGAKAVGGFLAGPLSATQLAPLSVTMDDFLTAVKKVGWHTVFTLLVNCVFFSFTLTCLCLLLVLVWMCCKFAPHS